VSRNRLAIAHYDLSPLFGHSQFVTRRRSLRNPFAREQPLDGGGERVDIDVRGGDPPFELLDQYQRSHWRRYEFALDQIAARAAVADLACGTGYGSVLLARKAASVLGVDIDEAVVGAARRRYSRFENVEFRAGDLRAIGARDAFDVVVSFETIEHFDEATIQSLLRLFATSLKPGGRLIFSTPYCQERSPEAIALGFHETFMIDETKLEEWLTAASLIPVRFHYQDYQTHTVRSEKGVPDFIVGIAAAD
jgi:2-polyprenyl-3-methyl-5-hydroxy-6-metoxy-1,4-benzoquinol methylase